MPRHILVITNGTNTVTLPVTKRITHSGSFEGTETVMADGTEKCDITGFRMTITYAYSYIPAADMAALHMLLRSGKYFTCTYLDVDNAEKTAAFKISYPQTDVFMYKGDVAVWQNASITLTAKGVI